jgi:hypothetical protein
MELNGAGPFVLVQQFSATPFQGHVHVLVKKTKTSCGKYVDDFINLLWRGAPTLITCTTCAADLMARALILEAEEAS